MTEQSQPRLRAADKLDRLRKALRRAHLDFDEVIGKCRRGLLQFHDTPRACAITAITVSGPYKTCHIVALAGEMSAVAELEAQVARYARDLGCTAIEGDARMGWGRIRHPAPGYKPILTKYRKELN